MYDSHGDVLYVGKARNLKNRLKSYFQKTLASAKVTALMAQVSHIEVTITPSENEALLLEHELIKRFKPHYNILLRDDKSYPYIHLTAHPHFPRLDFYRGKVQPNGHFFGPYPSSSAVRATLNLLQKLFKLRQCSDIFFQNRLRPCLQYQIKRCSAPCVNYIDEQSYAQDVTHTLLFLQGKNRQIIDELVIRMDTASQRLEYEQAAHFRDQIASLQKVQEQQIVATRQGDVDVIAADAKEDSVCVHNLVIRAGRVIGSRAYFPQLQEEFGLAEVLAAFVSQYYLNPVRKHMIPKVIITNEALPDKQWIAAVLSQQKGSQVTLLDRVKGDRAKWVKMAFTNAKQALHSHLSNKASAYRRMEALQKLLNLDSMPQRLECFDISHTAGQATVASCVVFDQNGPVPSSYRRFNIKAITQGDDYAAIKQAIRRHYKRLKMAGKNLADVLFIDGGKGQLRQAELALEELQVSGVVLVAVAKGPQRKAGLEQLFLAGRKTPLATRAHSIALHLIQHIRDEAHRFAITGHRQQRAKRQVSSTLQEIEGIGAKRRTQLLRHFGGMQVLQQASIDELAKVPGISHALAKKIFFALH